MCACVWPSLPHWVATVKFSNILDHNIMMWVGKLCLPLPDNSENTLQVGLILEPHWLGKQESCLCSTGSYKSEEQKFNLTISEEGNKSEYFKCHHNIKPCVIYTIIYSCEHQNTNRDEGDQEKTTDNHHERSCYH